jgi:Zn-dependent protease
MRDHSQWSVSLGRWGGVQVRLHLFLILFAAFTLYLSWVAAQQPQFGEYVWIGCLSLIILTLSVLAHEWGHVWAAQRLGGVVDQIVLWPLGGMLTPERPREPQADLIIQLAGPLTNFALALLCVPLLLLDDAAAFRQLLNPLQPVGLTEGSAWVVTWKLWFWVNYTLGLVNLFPAFPFDGGRIFRAALLLRWGEAQRPRVLRVVWLAAQISVIGLLVAAWLTRDWQPQSLLPTWFALVLLAIFLFFSAQNEHQKKATALEHEDLPFGYDFSQGYTSLERSYDGTQEDPGPISRWLEERREARNKRQQEIEQEEDRRMDEILARISVHGLQSLSAEERSLLERVSARYRHRHGQST